MKNYEIAVIIALFFVFACVSARVDPQLVRQNAEWDKVGIEQDLSELDKGPCLCSRCTGTPHSLLELIDWGDLSLHGGTCEFVACDFKARDRFKEGEQKVFENGQNNDFTIKDDDGAIVEEHVNIVSIGSLQEDETSVKLPFMFGQGGTFAEFEKSQQLCDAEFKLAVKWLEGGTVLLGRDNSVEETLAPLEPYKKQAECLLDANIIPVYIRYTHGKDLSYAPTGLSSVTPPMCGSISCLNGYAKNLKDVGPAIITPEALYDSNDEVTRLKVKEQINGIKQDCPNCLVMLVPKPASGDDYIKSINSVIDKVDSMTPPSDKVDLIGKIVVIGENNCDWSKALDDAAEDARATLRNFRKPTILLLYVEVDGDACTFSVEDGAYVYKQVANSITSLLLPNGILGVVQMQLQDRKPPADEVNGNAYGLVRLSEEMQGEGLKSPAFELWFNNCTQYYAQGEDDETKNYWQSLAIFSYQGKSGPYCQSHNNPALQAASEGEKSDPFGFKKIKAQESAFPQTIGSATFGIDLAAEKCFEEDYAPLLGGLDKNWGLGVNDPDLSITPDITDKLKLAVSAAAEKCDLDPSFLRAMLTAHGDLSIQALNPASEYGYKVGKICHYWQSQLDAEAQARLFGGIRDVTDETVLKNIRKRAAFFTAAIYAANELEQVPATGELIQSFRSDSKFYEKICAPTSRPDGDTRPTGSGLDYPCRVVDHYCAYADPGECSGITQPTSPPQQ